MKVRIPSKRVCERFHLTYELEGAKRGVDVLTKYYGIGRMEIVVDGRRVSGKWHAEYKQKLKFNPTNQREKTING